MSKDHLYYHALVDQCEQCLYVTHAFSLLGIPFVLHKNEITLSQLHNDHKGHDILFCCQHIEKNFRTEIATHFSLTVFFSDHPSSLKNASNKHYLFLSTPFTLYKFKKLLSDATESLNKSEESTTKNNLAELVGTSHCIKNVKSLIKKVSNCDSTVLIEGESGTGKEIIANCIHQLSSRNKMSFIPINCGAIPSELVESELFGHEKGAFTGAATRRPGRFELAQSGTLFLDEIGDMPLQMQVKLLRVIQEKKFERVGGHVSIYSDARIVSATNKNLHSLVEKNLFREDLFYRLNVFPIYVAPLRERAEDIPLLIDYYLAKIEKRIHHSILFSPEALEIMINYNWPGNVRELENLLERIVILHRDQLITESMLHEIYPHAFQKVLTA